ncbi:MAG: hypothetical protein ACOY99_05775 [Pseudomonadota bacterium]
MKRFSMLASTVATMTFAGAMAGIASAGLAPSAMAQEASGWAKFVKDAKPYADIRYRYEFVDQDGLPLNANASTLRTRVGVNSGEVMGFSLRLEGEGIFTVGKEKFNDTVNGRTQFPVVADPEDIVLNQAAIRWKGIKQVDAIVGRQVVNLDNQRWIGSVGWRQNDQTLDAAFATLKPVDGLQATYGYVWRVNRVFGPDSPQGTWRDNAIHIVNARYDLENIGTLTAYAYLLDIPDAPASSSQSYGARLAGKYPLGGRWSAVYEAEYARQSDYGDNPARFGLNYILVKPGLAFGPLTLSLGYEQLEGNGAVALQTPLATLHSQNGWADKFLVTPADGLEEFQVDATLKPGGPAWLKGTTMRVVYHDFSATRAGIDYGREWDALVSRGVGKYLVLTAKYAGYDSKGFATDTRKFWLMAEMKF